MTASALAPSVTAIQNGFGVKGPCVDRRKFAFRVHQPRNGRVVAARVLHGPEAQLTADAHTTGFNQPADLAPREIGQLSPQEAGESDSRLLGCNRPNLRLFPHGSTLVRGTPTSRFVVVTADAAVALHAGDDNLSLGPD